MREGDLLSRISALLCPEIPLSDQTFFAVCLSGNLIFLQVLKARYNSNCGSLSFSSARHSTGHRARDVSDTCLLIPS